MDRKLYKIVVADDENTIRRGICNFIDWKRMGYQIVADFEDGKELLEYLEKHEVDVVLTDIRMAELGGLDVARIISEKELPVKVVIISGYKEFDYAREALKYNVVNYILKPIQIDEIEKTFEEIYQQLQQKAQEKDQKKGMEEDILELLPELQEQFWLRVLLGGLRNRDNIIQQKEFLDLDFNTDTPCAIAEIQIDLDEKVTKKYYAEKNSRYNLLNNIFSGSVEGMHYYPVYLSREQLKIVITSATAIRKAEFVRTLERHLSDRSREIEELVSLKISYHLEQSFSNFTEMADYYASMQIHMHRKSERVYEWNEVDQQRLLQKYQLLMDIINSGDVESLDSQIGNIMFEFRELPLIERKNVIIDMFSMLLQRYMKMNQELWIDVKEQVDYSLILNAPDKESLQKICSDLIHRIKRIVEEHQGEVSRNITEQIMEYLKSHYQEDISLDLLADRYYLNPSYLSRMFKQCLGTGLTDYLIELRMENAKKLLLTGKYKVYEISQKVGYKSDKYFFRVFKSYTGQSPLEFCRSNVEEG